MALCAVIWTYGRFAHLPYSDALVLNDDVAIGFQSAGWFCTSCSVLAGVSVALTGNRLFLNAAHLSTRLLSEPSCALRSEAAPPRGSPDGLVTYEVRYNKSIHTGVSLTRTPG